MSTVRIYKVAELLGTSSQEVMALLKRDHGIEVKSASSTIEEVVARQFVERLARQRNIALPGGDMFAEGPPVRGGSRKPGPARKAEPPKLAPTLPPPRLVKTIRPRPVEPPPELEAPVEPTPTPEMVTPPAEPRQPYASRPTVRIETPPVPAPAEVPAPPPVAAEPVVAEALSEARPHEPEGVAEPEPHGASAGAPAETPFVAPPPAQPEPVSAQPPVEERAAAAVEPKVTEAAAAPQAAAPAPAEAAPRAEERPAEAPAPPRATPAPPAPAPRPFMPPPGRVVPPQLRLRVEESRPVTPPLTPTIKAPPAPLRPPAPKPTGQRPPERPAVPSSSQPAGTPTGAGARRVARPPAPGAVRRPEPAAPPSSMQRPPAGGPRPLPSQPVRPQAPRPSYPPPSRPGGAPRPPGRPGAGARPAHGGRRPHDRREAPRAPMSATAAAPPPITRTITLAEGMTVKDLADKLEVRTKDVLKKLLDKRILATLNTTLDTETATTLAREFGAEVQMRSFEEELLEVDQEELNPEDRQTRAPVVTVMGHVDHGKTTLLDGIRETRVAEHEAGGITQHIGAYNVRVNNRSVVFLDTPGHEAFTLMRARGARVTDVVVLVVAADDGVMPQTREAIDHAKAATVPIVVAINKIDRPDANPERVKRELADLGLVPEEWGGQTVMVEVSAKKRQNLDLLLEMILLVTDIGELKANPKRGAVGTVLEAKLDKGRGPVATILVQDGTLHVGDTFIAGPIVGKVRALLDDRGRHVKAAPPSTPVEVLGLAGLPQPGDAFQAIADAAKARQVAMFRQTQAKEKAMVGGRGGARLTLDSLKQQIAEGEVKELPIVIKADVQGSAEVLADTLTKLSDDRVKIRIIHSGVGAINESDILLASASNAIVIGFNVRPDRNAADMAEREHLDVRLHSIIYNVIDEMKKAMTGLLEPTLKEVRLGIAEVRDTFKVPKFGTIAGCMVTEGRITRSGDAQARLLRDNVVVFEGRIGSLRRFKDDVSEVKSGFECGIGLERYNDIKVGDMIEVFTVERVAVTA